jgi:hypothetical protein
VSCLRRLRRNENPYPFAFYLFCILRLLNYVIEMAEAIQERAMTKYTVSFRSSKKENARPAREPLSLHPPPHDWQARRSKMGDALFNETQSIVTFSYVIDKHWLKRHPIVGASFKRRASAPIRRVKNIPAPQGVTQKSITKGGDKWGP